MTDPAAADTVELLSAPGDIMPLDCQLDLADTNRTGRAADATPRPERRRGGIVIATADRCDSRLYWTGGTSAICCRDAGHDGRHHNSTLRWNDEAAETNRERYGR